MRISSGQDSAVDRLAAVAWLAEHRPAEANTVLCVLYGAVCHQVGERDAALSVQESDVGRWYVSLLSGSRDSVADLPLSDTLPEAQALAVERLRLWERFEAQLRGETSVDADLESALRPPEAGSR